MKITKFIGLGALSLSVSLLTAACGIFESTAEEPKDAFWVDVDAKKAQENTAVPTGNGGASDLHSVPPEGPGEFTETSELFGEGYVDGVGPRVPGVNFETVYFAFDDNTIQPAEYPKIYHIADYLLAHPDTGVVIEGNCDNRGSEEYNRALGEKRALAAKFILLDRGIAENRIKVISYGEERPAIIGENESAWSQNRRDDFVPVYLLNR